MIKGENKALNCVRTAAAVIVLISHTRGYLMEPRTADDGPLLQALYAVTSLGHGAVVLFFLLSGYFVGGSVFRSYAEKRFSWDAYLNARLVRLWLVLLPAIILTLFCDAVGMTLFPRAIWYSPPENNLSTLTIIGNIVFLQPSIVPPLGSNSALWSLGYEFSYYLLLPLILMVAQRDTGTTARLIAISLLVVIIALIDNDVLLLSVPWLIGAVMGFYAKQILQFVSSLSTARYRCALAASFSLLFLTMLLTKFQGASHGNTTWGVYALSFAAALFIALLITDPAPKGQFAQNVINFLNYTSHSSYSIYAFHLPILTLVAAAFLSLEPQGLRSNAVGWVIVLIVTLFLCICGHALALVTERKTDIVRSRIKVLRARAFG